MGKGRSTEFKVGIFVFVALAIGAALVFTLGNRSALFASRRTYVTTFTNVAGLRPGSPVRLAGIDVGTVSEISFADGGRLRVVLEVREDVARLVTGPTGPELEGATVATLGSKGLLGDMIVELNPGEGDALPEGAEIPSRDTGGLLGALSRAGELVDEAEPVIRNVRLFTEGLADEQFREDLHRISHNVAELTRMIVEEDGTIPRLIRDPELADQVESTLAAVQVTTTELAQTSRNIRAITNEIRDGDGTAHELIYGQDGVRLVSALADTAGEAATILRDVRTGEGNAHELLYGDNAGDLIENLTAMSHDLRAVVADVRAGRGTIGGLLVDPSIYEDVKRIVGNLERNDILRALVRYSIREDEPVPATPIAAPADAPPP